MNKYISALSLLLLLIISCKTSDPGKRSSGNLTEQKNKSATVDYRSSYLKLFDLVHTELELKPDWERQELFGRAGIRLKPHFYPSDSLILNARGMEIHSVEIEHDDEVFSVPFRYENNLICIKLDRIYTRNESLTVIINYTSRPETLPEGGSAAIRKDKGLYFINADGSNQYKPKQLWTQGETESNSVWFPTIEDPAQRMTQEIYITVDTSLKTLSNGLHLSSINNPDGTRTDYWRQDFALAPYLTMIAAGDFAVISHQWKDKEVSYYIDKEYEKYANMIFGITPEMMDFFSGIFGYDYPWEKYSQVVVHDFVSGAMENNTAVVHGTNMLQDPREHKDYNYEDIISHELTHHWFGNLVTCESWANITLNEGFASYGEYLWREFKYGRENADEFGRQDQNIYLRATKKGDAPLIRFEYENREDVYDAISYQKGARVLHMLRKLIGDDAFFTSLRNYIRKYQFSAVEFHQLRLEFEAVIGEDLNWFFDQWFQKAGKPSLDISTQWSEENHELKIILKQTQNLKNNPVYRLPMDVDFYLGSEIVRKRIVMDSLEQIFMFSLSREPELINVDAEKMLLLEKKSDNKNTTAWIYQYNHAPLFLDRYEAINALGKNYRINTPEAETIVKAISDSNADIRMRALNYIRELASNSPHEIQELLVNLAKNDSNSHVRAAAYDALGEFYPYKDFKELFEKAIPDYSYYVEATAFNIIAEKDPNKALQLADILEKDSSSIILSELSSFYAGHPELEKINFYRRALYKSLGWTQYRIVNYFASWLKAQKISVIREGGEILLETGLNSNGKYIRNNCAAALILLQNELNERTKSNTKMQIKTKSDPKQNSGISADEVELMQIEALKKDLEVKIKLLESKL